MNFFHLTPNLLVPQSHPLVWFPFMSPTYSSFYYAHHRIGAGLLTPFMVYGDQWRTHRKLWHNHIGPQAIVGYHGRLRRTVLEFVSSLHEQDSGLEQDACGAMTKSVCLHPL